MAPAWCTPSCTSWLSIWRQYVYSWLSLPLHAVFNFHLQQWLVTEGDEHAFQYDIWSFLNNSDSYSHDLGYNNVKWTSTLKMETVWYSKTLIPAFFKINFNIILPFMPRSKSSLSPSDFHTKTLYTFILFHICYMFHLSHPPLSVHANNIL
jgi:hypothetical protein